MSWAVACRDGANVPAAQSIAAANPPVPVLRTISRPAEALTEVGNDGGARTFSGEVVNACVDRPEKSARSGVEQHAPSVSNRRRDVPRPGWVRPPPETGGTRTAVTRTRTIRLARQPAVLRREVNSIRSSRVCPSSQRVSIIRAHVAGKDRRAPDSTVIAAGRWLLLAGLLFMVTGDGPTSTIRVSKWPTPFPFLAYPWLYLSLLLLGIACFVAGGGVKSWKPSHFRFIVVPTRRSSERFPPVGGHVAGTLAEHDGAAHRSRASSPCAGSWR